MAVFASNSDGHTFPVGLWADGEAGWADFRAVMAAVGTTLKERMQDQGFQDFIYQPIEIYGEAGSDYFFIFRTAGVPENQPGALIEVRPSGINRWTGSL
jgi:hypothetical protein